MKEEGALILSLRGVNYGYWYYLGCLEYFLSIKVQYVLGLYANK